jgi:hypothetical protein
VARARVVLYRNVFSSRHLRGFCRSAVMAAASLKKSYLVNPFLRIFARPFLQICQVAPALPSVSATLNKP